MTRTTRRRLGWTRLILIFIAAVLVLWCGYWFATNRMAEAAAERLVAALAADGRALTCTEDTTGGFPLSLDLNCGEAKYDDKTAGVSVALSKVSATAPLYRPGSASAAVAGPMTFDAPAGGVSFDASWTAAVAHVDAGLSGLEGARLDLDGLRVRPKGVNSAAPFARLDAGHAEMSAEPAGNNAYRLVLRADDVQIKPQKGRDMPKIGTELDLTAADFGSSLGTDPARSVRTWLARGGTVDVKRIALSLGDVSAEGSGQLQLSPQGLLSGSLTIRLTGLNKLPDAVDKIQPGAKDKVAQVVGAAGVFSKAVKGDKNIREAPIVIRDGVVTVGVIPVATIPPLKF
jgi:hypothetical protein